MHAHQLKPSAEKKKGGSAPSPSEDHFEREADEAADRVLRMSAPPVLAGAPMGIQRKCAHCTETKKCAQCGEEETIQRKAAGGGGAGGAMDTHGAMRAAGSGGSLLSSGLRHFFEPRFGHDLSRVRIHTGPVAEEAARGVHARAYTVGQSIVFGAGEYAPGTMSGRRLLAHELAHVIQQRKGVTGSGVVQRQQAPAPTAPAPLTPAPWTPPIRSDEMGAGRTDALGGTTFDCRVFSVFIPAGAATVTTNKVHIFFSPGDVTGPGGSNATAVHGLRGAANPTQWILISVPSGSTISDSDITSCLGRVGRAATIAAVRMSAHSRGAQMLANTLQQRLITPGLIEHVTVLDATDHAHGLTAGFTASHVPLSRVTAYNVVFGSLPGAGIQNIQLRFGCVRSIGYARLITDGVATGRAPTPLPAGIATKVSALTLPARGSFTTSTPTPAGKTDLNTFCGDPANRAALAAMRSGEPASPTSTLSARELTRLAPTSPYAFIEENNVMGFNSATTPRANWLHFNPQIYSHHLFVAEIANELFS